MNWRPGKVTWQDPVSNTPVTPEKRRGFLELSLEGMSQVVPSKDRCFPVEMEKTFG